MKICFIWVANFRNFEDLGFNLSSSSKFTFDSYENILTKEDGIVPLPHNFFGENIIDVTGVVGKNGVGKSNAIALICTILKSAKTFLKSSFIIITEEENALYYYSNFQDEINIKSNFKITRKEYHGVIDPLKVIFFSNVFDDRRNDFSKEVADISVNKLSNRLPFFNKNDVTDFEKQIRLIDSQLFGELNIDLPSKVKIDTKIWVDESRSFYSDRFMSRELYDIIASLNKFLRERIRDIKPTNKFINSMKFGTLLEFIKFFCSGYQFPAEAADSFVTQLYTLTTGLDGRDSEGKFIKTDDIMDKSLLLIENVINSVTGKLGQVSFVTLFDKRNSKNAYAKIEGFRQQISLAREANYYVEDSDVEFVVEGLRNRRKESYFFDYNSSRSRNFIYQFVRSFGGSNLFDINWVGISSGHRAYLNIFASLYQELRFTKQINLLLCIDEGDLYLHPIWQTEFFDKLLKVIPKMFAGKVQLVLTSHSPFLLSDLPNQSITILDKDVKGSTIDGTDLRIKTFGGNLYNLYSEPFFLGNRRMSNFAYSKIKNLIDKVELITTNGTIQSLSNEEMNSIIEEVNLIGDEVIKFKLERALKK